MSKQESFICDVCKQPMPIDAQVVLGVEMTIQFSRFALDMPRPTAFTRHVCPSCYPTATLPQITGEEKPMFYLI